MVKQIGGIIGWVGTALVFGAVAIRFLRPEWMQYGTYMTWAGLVCILAYMLAQWRDVMSFYGTRQARYGTVSIVGILVAIGIFAAVNYLGSRETKRWDLTENQAHSLSEQSIKILQGLDEPVQFTVYDQDTGFDRFRNRFETYRYESNQVKVEYVDIDRQPARAKEAGITQYGTVVATYRDREQRLTTSIEEQDITNALIKLVSGAEKKVYFTVGHGEREADSADRMRGYNAINEALGRDNFQVASLPLIQQGQVPDDATVVAVAGPTTDFLAPEIDALKRYLARGGKLLVLLDPPPAEGGDLTNLIGLLEEWSIELGTDVVVDASGIGQLFGGDASVPVVVNYPPHPITDNFRVMTAFPHARSVQAAQGGTHTPQPLLETSQQSWAETDLESFSAGNVEFAEDADRRGPISLGVAVSAPATEAPAPPLAGNESPDAPKPESRIVVIGDSDFAGNNAVGIQGNQDLFLNAVNWLAQQEDLIAIRPRDAQDRRITLTADDQQRVMLLSLLVIPGLVFAAGVYSWWRRR
ncbi:MAG TPA: Gldg family protein [Vicinamibacterales bacterium]|nr:Gldg family protein [Vicinamibacterales bacterium]